MTEEELELIVRKHEMRKLELKESFGNECIETACAFANAEGGLIVIGVDDKGNPSKRQLRHEALRDYEKRISTATEPAVAVDAKKVSFHGRDVVVIKVQENPIKPVAFKLPFDMPLELLMNPLHASRPRNKIIAQAFFDMGIIEHYGRGIIRIKEECDKNGNPYPAWKDEYGSFVTEYIPRIAHSRNVQTTTLPVQTTTVPVQTTTVRGQTATVRGQTAILPAQTTTAQEQSDTALPEELLAELGSLGKKAPSNRIADLMVRLCEHRPMTKKDLMRHLKRGEATINRIAASLLGTRLAYRYPNMIHHPRQAYVAVATTILKEKR